MPTARPEHEEKSESCQIVWCILLYGLDSLSQTDPQSREKASTPPLSQAQLQDNEQKQKKKRDQPSTGGTKNFRSS